MDELICLLTIKRCTIIENFIESIKTSLWEDMTLFSKTLICKRKVKNYSPGKTYKNFTISKLRYKVLFHTLSPRWTHELNYWYTMSYKVKFA